MSVQNGSPTGLILLGMVLRDVTQNQLLKLQHRHVLGQDPVRELDLSIHRDPAQMCVVKVAVRSPREHV